jgi:hypothetical protein
VLLPCTRSVTPAHSEKQVVDGSSVKGLSLFLNNTVGLLQAGGGGVAGGGGGAGAGAGGGGGAGIGAGLPTQASRVSGTPLLVASLQWRGGARGVHVMER